MKKMLLGLLFIALIAGSFVTGYKYKEYRGSAEDPVSIEEIIIPKPLRIYEFENLIKTDIEPGVLEINENVDEEENHNSHLFEFHFKPDLKNTKKTTGLINIPVGEGPFPVIIMIRGFVSQEIYETGMGTKNAANFFANNGFITIAPDFLGYAGSDSESGDIFETRFQTYTTVLSLLKTLEEVEFNPSIISWPSGYQQPLITNHQPPSIWAHSNGGQVALTVLGITGKNYPAALWAPVSVPFPYSILYYTDEAEDKGKFLRKELAKFEELYDVDSFTFTNYLDRVNAPILLQQGSADDAVPLKWSNGLSNLLLNLDKDLTYKVYSQADHNMRPAWNEAVEDDLEYFRSKI